MILFKPYHIWPIIEGIKIHTRRMWKSPRAKVGSIHLAQIFFAKKASAFAALRIRAVYPQPLGEMNEDDAKKEGGYTLDQYQQVWEMINGEWDDALEPFVVVFENDPGALLQNGLLVAPYAARRGSPWHVDQKPSYASHKTSMER